MTQPKKPFVVDGKIVAAGLDVGFRKTGVAIFDITEFGDQLTKVTTICAPDQPGTTLVSDLSASWIMENGLDAFLNEHNVRAVFAEFPTGGAQSGRAARCMGMATGMAASLFYGNNWPFEVFLPDEIEKSLGIYISRQEKTKLGLSGAKLRKRRKDLQQKCVIDEYPDFDGWPKTQAAGSEDAFDAAAAFLAAKRMGSDCLYARLRNMLKKG